MKLISALGILVATVVVAFLIAWFGLFNVSAKDKHWQITNELLEFVRERSIEVRADNIEVPSNLSDKDTISKGAKNFDAMCAQCHLSPITEPTELSIGLYPQPPAFYKINNDYHDAKNTFWVIKNGLKLTGMPAWGDFHTDQQMWEMVAFLDVINGLSADEYRQLVGEGGHTHKPGSGHGDANTSGGHDDDHMSEDKEDNSSHDDEHTHAGAKASDSHHEKSEPSASGHDDKMGGAHKH